MNKKLKRILFLTVGVFFILFGLVSFALPFLQGFLFIAIGLIIISIYSPKIRVWMDAHTKRYPQLHKIVEQTEKWVVKIIGRP